MRLRKLLAMLLIMSMLVSFIPASVFATEAEEGTGNTGTETGTAKLDNLFLDKKAVLKDDGTYTIDLEAYATGTTINKTITEGVPLDVVMVIDQSGSLYKTNSLDTLKSSVHSFLEDLNANGEQFGVNHRVAICGFASYGKQGTAGLASDGYTYANDNWDNVWTNTGIFVDGEFQDYGTVEYTKVEDESEISTSGVYAVAVKFDGQEKAETINVFYREYYWRTASSGQPVNLLGPVLQENAAKYLFDSFNGYVYEIGDSVNLLTDEDYAASWENIASGSNGQGGINPNITEAVNHLASNGATATFMGMKMARKMLENAPDDGISRKKVVIVFTDGEPGASGYAQGDADAALAEAMRIKETGTKIYTIGIYGAESAETAELFMNQLSSNYVSHSFTTSPITLTTSMIKRTTDDGFGYSDVGNMYYTRNIDYTITGISPYFNKDDNGNYWPINILKAQDTYYISCLTDDGEDSATADSVYQLTEHIANSDPNADYYKYASSIDELSGIFETISSEVTSYTSQLSLDANAILKDVLADGFTLTDKTTVTVSVVPGSVSEENKNLSADQLTDDKITWGNPQQVLSFAYPAKTSADGKVTVTGAADQTQMTLTAAANADGEITVTGFNYAKPEDADNINAQYISYGHPGSKLVVTITGVEAEADITTDSVIATNQTTSGIYEGLESDADGDEEKGEIQASFPVPTTYLSSKTYYVDYSGELVIDPADFLMTIKGVSADIDGYNYFNTNTPGTTLELEHGTVTVREDGKWVFTMDPGDWSITDSFFLFGTTDDTTVTGATANKDGNMWSKITIITPADVRGNLFLNKEATLTGDGTYTIDLEAFSTGTPSGTIITEGIPLDVVLVVDQSGSLYKYGYLETLKKSVAGFMEALYLNGEANGVDHRVAICGFASNATRGPGGLEATGYTYACKEKDLAWTNTGIFVNGEFKKWGTFDYTPIYDPKDVDRNRMYGLMWDTNEDGTPEMAVARIRNNEWQVWDSKLGYKTVGKDIKDADGVIIQTREENMMENYHVIYDLREITNTLTDADFAAAWEHLANDANGQGGINKDITTTVENLCSNGSTYTMYGLKLAQQMLKNAYNDGIERKKVVVVFTDGEPGQNGYNKGDADGALLEAKRIKDQGIEIYGIGMYSKASANQENFMNRMSSNYEELDYEAVAELNPNNGNGVKYALGLDMMYYAYTPYFYKDDNGNYWPIVLEYENGKSNYIYASYVADEGYVPIEEGEKSEIAAKVGQVYTLTQGTPSTNPEADYYKYAKNTSELAGIFTEFAESMTTEKRHVVVDAAAVLKDVMAEGFTLTDNTTVTVSVVPGSVKEEYAELTADALTADHIAWGNPQEVLSFAYPDKTSSTGTVTVTGAADQTQMTLTATATADGVITVTGFNYASPADNWKNDAQYINADHPGSKLVVTVTGVEAKADVATDSITVTNKGTSGIYESEDSDLDGDGVKGELQASFPVPTTYLSSKTYYVDYSGELVIDPADFLMTIKGVSADIDGYNYFNPNTPGTTLELTHGTVTVRDDGMLLYTMNPGAWDSTDTFYLFGETDDATVTGTTANKDGNMWSKITLITPKDAGGKLFLDKEATLTGDGTYTIDLEGFATGTPATTVLQEGVPLDVVLVLDQSGSMVKGDFGTSVEVFKQSVSTFIDALNANGMSFGVNHRVAVCGFGNDGTNCVSGLAAQGYGYAGEAQESAWCNTGLFVNGEFINYGTMEYIPVSDINEIKTSPYYLHSIDYDADGDGKMERVALRYSGGKWVTGRHDAYTVVEPTTAEDGTTISATENLFANYTVYINKKVSNQLTDEDYANAWGNLAAGENGGGGLNPDVAKVIESLTGNGSTYTFYGMKMAAKMLENCPDDGIARKKIVILFTDGQPGYNGYVDGDGESTLAESVRIKEMGAEIYAIGLYKSTTTKAEKFMNQLSSNSGIHSFQSEPVRIDVSKGGASTSNTFAKFAPQIDGTWGGFTPYFYKVDNADGTSNYYPISMYAPDSSCASFNVYYITDEGQEVLLTECKRGEIAEKVGDVYRLDLNSVNTDLDAGYYKRAESLDQLEDQFKNIANQMTTNTTETTLDADAILKDVLADGFTLTDNTTITVSVVPGSVGEAYQDVAAADLSEDMIVWSAPQEVLSFSYPAETQGTGKVTVNGAADQTEMTITAKATADGVITVTGFNYANPTDSYKKNAQYINADHPGSKLVVTVTGVEAKADVVTDSITVTNKGTSGIYESEDSDLDDDGVKGELQASFPVPTTYLTSKVYVSDYAKPMTVDPADWKMNDGVISVDADGYNHFAPAVTAVTETYGKVAVNDGKIIYTPTKTSWDNFDTFYIFGTTNDETVKAATANAGGNMWAKVSVIPANNVYYEDTFVTSEDTGIAGIVYGGVWENIGEDDGQGENAESGESTDGDNQGGVHGWENTLADDTGFSDGSAHISTTVGATATFTFTGTGVDIYSRTNMQTGIVMAMLYEGRSITNEDGKNKIAEYGLMVDNLAASGDYYQIPTLSLCQIPVREDDGKIVLDENGNMVMEDMPYGTYTVKIVVSKATADQTDAERLTYYLDGIRVYNPIQELEGNSTVSGAYGDKELNAKFVEIRDKLLDASAFTVENEEAAGPVFIDRITGEDGEHTDNTVTLEVGEYEVFGPKNEVYLSAGQTVAFAVAYAEDAHYYIGMKSLTGKTAGVVVSDADSGTSSLSIGHTTDLYYEVNPVWTDENGNSYTDAQGNPIGIISIMADAQNGQSAKDANGNDIYNGTILALTKLKVTGPKAKDFRFAKVSKSKLVESAQKAANNLPDMDAGNSDTQNSQLGKVAKWNIALQEDLEVKFYLQISEGMEDTAKVSLSMGSGNIIYDVSALEKTEEGYYLLKARLAATQMSETMSLQLIHGDDACEIGTYSVRGYCDTILSSDEYRAYHTLVKEMLNYGGMAQLYFNYETLNLANAGITDTAAAAVPESTAGMAVTDKLSGVDFYGASLVYRDKIALRYYFTGDVTGLTFTANGKTYTPVAKGDMYYVEIADILPQELDQQITLTAMDADGNAISVAYGPMNYIVRMHAKGSDALKNLMKALYNYHLAAKAWSEQ